MQITTLKPRALILDSINKHEDRIEVPPCVAAANGTWCDLNVDQDDADEEFDEEDFDDDFDDDFEEEEYDGYGDFDDTKDPFASDDEEEDSKFDDKSNG